MSDSAVLLAHMTETAGPDGAFGENLNVTAATIGWMPSRLSEALQDLVADGKIEPTHADGDPTRIAGSSWRVLLDGAAPAAGDELGDLKVPELRKLAKERGVDLKGLKAKDDIVAAIQKHQAATADADAEPVDLSGKDVDELIQFAGENEIELPEGDLEQADLVEYIEAALAERDTA